MNKEKEKTTTPKHTPTPFLYYGNEAKIIFDDKDNIVAQLSADYGNQFGPQIVLAVNSYDKDQEVIKGLVEAAANALTLIWDYECKVAAFKGKAHDGATADQVAWRLQAALDKAWEVRP